MYGWLWRTLPGGWPLKTLQSLVLFFGVCVVLLLVVFPWVEPKLPFSDNVVDGSVPASTAEPTGGDAGTGGGADGTGDDGDEATGEADATDEADAAGDEADGDGSNGDGDTDDGGDQITLPGEG